jgi:hypothetical protein
MFPHAEVNHLVSSRSDHCPLLVNLEKNSHLLKAPKLPRYEIMWERDINLTNEISLAWKKHDHAVSLQGIRDKLKSTMSCLQSWSSLNFGAVTKEITKLKKDLERL